VTEFTRSVLLKMFVGPLLQNMQHGTLYAHLLREEPPFTIGHSPIDRLGTQFPPIYLLAAMADHMVPVQQSFILKEKLEDTGVDLIFDPVDGASHGFVDMASQAWPQGNDYWQGHILPACQWAKAKAVAVLDE
jgi:acetyl esterase/lipase